MYLSVLNHQMEENIQYARATDNYVSKLHPTALQ